MRTRNKFSRVNWIQVRKMGVLASLFLGVFWMFAGTTGFAQPPQGGFNPQGPDWQSRPGWSGGGDRRPGGQASGGDRRGGDRTRRPGGQAPSDQPQIPGERASSDQPQIPGEQASGDQPQIPGGQASGDQPQIPGGQASGPGEQAPGDQPRQPQIPLEQALEGAGPTVAIRLNQREFTTSDGVQLVANFYKGNANEETIPVILLHDVNEQKEKFDALAQALATQGYAVLVPDLRGCGESVKRSVGDYSRGNVPTRRQDAEYSMKNFTNDDLRAMIEYDKQLWFNFLIYLHNQGMLNVKKTVIVGAGLGAAVGASWTKNDWTEKSATGQNVVGLALLSPDATSDAGKFNALPALEAIRKRAKGKDLFGYVVFVGSMTDEKLEAAKEIQEKVGGKAEAELPPEEKTVPIVALKTEKQGSELLTIESFGVAQTIAQFVATRMQNLPKKRLKWEEIVEKSSRRD